MNAPDTAAFLSGIVAGNPRAVARAISQVENDTVTGRAILRAIQPYLGRARVLGVTGSPGAGKSTLVNELIGEFGRHGHSVAVVAVDPSSPFSGGAVLGDRVRMERHSLTERVFIRSLASRGNTGGLSRAVFRVVDVIDAAGFDRIIVETVGAGQTEVDIADVADIRVVVCAPGLGDDVQAIKAGILEIADILVVSKCDLPLADKTELDLRFMLSVRQGRSSGPRLMRVTATSGVGIPELVEAIESDWRLAGHRRRQGASERMRRLLRQEAAEAVRRRLAEVDAGLLAALCDALAIGEIGFDEAVDRAIDLARDPGRQVAVRADGND